MSNVELPVIECSYYDTEEINRSLTNLKGTLIFHHNIHSFNKNFDNLSIMLNEIKTVINVIILTETWFIEVLCQEIDGYVGYHMYRKEGTGEGVSVYVRSILPSSFIPQFSSVTETSEICAVEITLADGNRKDRYKILGIYRPPAASLPAFSYQIEHIIPNFLNESVLLVGDFNIDLLCETRNENFFNLLYSYHFSPLINLATRETNTSSDAKKKKVFSNRVFFLRKRKQVFFFSKKTFLFIYFLFFFKYGININTQVETTLLWDLFSIYDTVSNYFTSLLLI